MNTIRMGRLKKCPNKIQTAKPLEEKKQAYRDNQWLSQAA